MISGIGSSLSGLQSATARHERAAVRAPERVAPESGSVAGDPAAPALSGATAQMASSRFAVLASLRAAQSTTEMVADTVQRMF
jgi:hypothetical protein